MKIVIEKFDGRVESVSVETSTPSECQSLIDTYVGGKGKDPGFPDTVISLNTASKAYYEMNPQKIPLIKFIRILTGWGLKESKDYAEQAVIPHVYVPAGTHQY